MSQVSPYEQYMKEREGIDFHKSEHGFVAYKIESSHLFLLDVWVAPTVRRARICYSLVDQLILLAKQKGCTTVHCQTDVRTKNPEISLLAIINYGFKINGADRNLITYVKEI